MCFLKQDLRGCRFLLGVLPQRFHVHPPFVFFRTCPDTPRIIASWSRPSVRQPLLSGGAHISPVYFRVRVKHTTNSAGTLFRAWTSKSRANEKYHFRFFGIPGNALCTQEHAHGVYCCCLAWVSRSRMCWSPVDSRPATRPIVLPLRTPPQLGISPPAVTSSGTFAVASVGSMPSTD